MLNCGTQVSRKNLSLLPLRGISGWSCWNWINPTTTSHIVDTDLLSRSIEGIGKSNARINIRREGYLPRALDKSNCNRSVGLRSWSGEKLWSRRIRLVCYDAVWQLVESILNPFTVAFNKWTVWTDQVTIYVRQTSLTGKWWGWVAVHSYKISMKLVGRRSEEYLQWIVTVCSKYCYLVASWYSYGFNKDLNLAETLLIN